MNEKTSTKLFWIEVLILLGAETALSRNAASKLDQKTLDAISVNLNVRYSVEYNGPPAGCHVRLELQNTGNERISTAGDWAVYFCMLRPIRSDSSNLRISHVNGCLHRLQITTPSAGMTTRQTLTVYFNAASGSVARTDVMPNWYVAAEGLQARTLLSTAGESLSFVSNFDDPKQWKLGPWDKQNPFTPTDRFGKYDIPDLDKLAEDESSHLIVPQPLELKDLNRTMHIDLRNGKWAIHSDEGLDEDARFLANNIKANITRTINAKETIHLKIGDVIIKDKETENSEAYVLKIDAVNTNISIVGRSRAAVFWGIQSLLSLEHDGHVYHVTISDEPRYKFRELGIDLARNFQSKEEIMKIIDVMATYKLNKLHLHLTDDEGWRLEIPGLPELTEIGSRRCDDQSEQSCILSQLGSGPYTNNSGTGYYTSKDYREILEHARRNHVQVIPEIDLPGHSHAAIVAMQNRFKKYERENKIVEGQQYLLKDPKDESHFQSVQLYKDNAINPCLESTFTFVKHIVSAVKRLHSVIQPLHVIHVGGDEVSNVAWTKSPACAKLAIDLKIARPTHRFWMKRFLARVAAIAGRHGLDLAVWGDAVKNDGESVDITSFPSQKIYSYAWQNRPIQEAYKKADSGFKVIMAQATHLYLDQPYEPDPEERGLYWATRFTDTRKLFGFTPIQRKRKVPTSENIEGMAAFLWSETVRTPEQLEYMIFPRLLAFAERAWYQAAWEGEDDDGRMEEMRNTDWRSFGRALGRRELLRLGKMNIAYRIPLPGARMKNRELQTSVAFPGLPIQYSEDGGVTWENTREGLKPTRNRILLRTRSADGERTSRVIELTVA